MNIIPPVTINDAILSATNIVEDDAPVWDNTTSYGLGDNVIDNHSVYESLITGNVGNDPSTSSLSWLRLGATNRYKAFDQRIGDRVVNADSVTYTIDHNGEFLTAVAAFGIVGATMEIEVTDPTEGVVFFKSYPLLDNSEVTDYYSYFFSPVGVQEQEVLEVEIPPYLNASTKVTILNTGSVAEVGQLVFGRLIGIGVATFGVGLSLKDYSRKERDAFGNPIIVERAFAQNVDFPVILPTISARRLQNTLAKYRAKPVVWVGDNEEGYGTLVYGYYNRFDILLSNPEISEATIEVEGLV